MPAILYQYYSSWSNIVYYDCIGVYISHNGDFINPESNIAITDIGTTPSGHLVCVTDRQPCCRGQNNNNQVNNWKFPDGGWVMSHSSMPVNFKRDRSDAGEINLYRVSVSVTAPTGRFCCVALDAIGSMQTHCIYLGKSGVA